MITPPDPSPGSMEELTLDSWDLCREFVEALLSDAQAVAAREHPGQPVREVDWPRIWQAGDGASSDERAIGRIVRVAAEIAREISGEMTEVVGPPLGRHAAPPTEEVARPDPALARPTAVVAAPVIAAAPQVGTVERRLDAETAMAPTTAAQTLDLDTVTVDDPDAAATTVLEPIVVPVVEPITEQVPLVDSALVPPEPEDEADGATQADAARSRRAARRSGWITAYTWMSAIGAIILLFVAWQLWGTSISQHHAQDQLKSQFDAAVQAHHPTAAKGKANGSASALIPAGENLPNPPDGTVIAHLQIPAIGLDEYVVSGSNASDLSKGPGHYVGTAMPGQAGNVAIAGHRTTNGAPFNRIGQLTLGDRVFLTTLTGEHLTYVVSAAPVSVSPRDVSVLNYFGDNRVTLTTCTPEFSAAQRLIVVGQLKEPAGTPKAPAKDVTYHVANSANASWNWSLLPTVGVEACLLLLLGLSYRRFGYWFEKTSKWIVLVPLWAAGLYLLFDTLTKFLPASL
ncbi:MAG TPA: sortase [Acidimicrobiales bacterium]|nr:sortase [Acidimicrobiales bacterium]